VNLATLPEHLQEGRTAEEALELERADAVRELQQVRTDLAELILELAEHAEVEPPVDAETALRRIGVLAGARSTLDDLARTFGHSDAEHVEAFEEIVGRIQQERQQ